LGKGATGGRKERERKKGSGEAKIPHQKGGDTRMAKGRDCMKCRR